MQFRVDVTGDLVEEYFTVTMIYSDLTAFLVYVGIH